MEHKIILLLKHMLIWLYEYHTMNLIILSILKTGLKISDLRAVFEKQCFILEIDTLILYLAEIYIVFKTTFNENLT